MTRKTRFFLFASALVLIVGLCSGLLAYYGGLPTFASSRSAGPEELKYVPSGAAVVAYANVRDVMASDFRQKLRHVLPEHDKHKGQEEFERETGINIETDIDYVLAWMMPPPEAAAPGASQQNQHPAGLVLLRGRFDQGRLEAAAVQHGAEAVTLEGGIKAVRLPKHDKPGLLAFMERGLLALGDEATVRAAAATRGAGDNIRSNDELMGLLADLEGSGNLWAVGRVDALANHARLPDPIASQIPSVRWFSASSQVDGGLSAVLRAEARDDEAAKNLRDVIQGFIALARLQAGSKPELQPLIQSIQLSSTGKTVALSFEVPAALIDAWSESKRPAN